MKLNFCCKFPHCQTSIQKMQKRIARRVTKDKVSSDEPELEFSGSSRAMIFCKKVFKTCCLVVSTLNYHPIDWGSIPCISQFITKKIFLKSPKSNKFDYIFRLIATSLLCFNRSFATLVQPLADSSGTLKVMPIDYLFLFYDCFCCHLKVYPSQSQSHCYFTRLNL